MSTTAPASQLTFADTPRVSMATIVKVELRKMVDTRAGKWLLITIAALTALVLVIFYFAGSQQDHTFVNSMQAAATPQGILLPVLGILLITQEWGQRTGMVTFTLVPRRSHVLWAKVISAVILGVAAVILALGLAALVTAAGGATDGFHGVNLAMLLRYVMFEVLGVLGGLVFGLLFLNTAAAIVVSFALPIAFSIVTSIWTAMHHAQPWIDQGTSQAPLQTGDVLSSSDWAHLLSTTAIWVILPFAIGMWRVLRTEVK